MKSKELYSNLILHHVFVSIQETFQNINEVCVELTDNKIYVNEIQISIDKHDNFLLETESFKAKGSMIDMILVLKMHHNYYYKPEV